MVNVKKMNRRLFFIYLLILTCLFFFFSKPVAGVSAQEPTPSDDEVNAIASRLFCPVCQNTPLDVCDTEACRQWRDLIRQMLADGKTEDEIFEYFTENYGIRVLAEPPIKGFNWLVYVVPPAAFLSGLFFLYKAFVTWKKLARERSDEVGNEMPTHVVDDSYAASFTSEAAKRDKGRP